MATFYVDSSIVGSGGVGSFADPFKTFAQWSATAAGSVIIFRGSGSSASPRQYSGGGTLTQKNYTLKNHTDEHVEFADTSRAPLLLFNRWTSGGGGSRKIIEVQGTGTITFGACQTTDPTADANWGASESAGRGAHASLVLEGCDGGSAATSLIIDGNPGLSFPSAGATGVPTIAECGIKFKSGSDLGLFICSDSTAQVGSRFITTRFVEATNNGAGIHIQSPADDSRTPKSWHTGDGLITEYSVLHDNNKMLVNTGGGDVGAQGIGLSRPWGTVADPLVIRYCHIYNNHSDSAQYGEDGIGIEWYGSGHHRYYGNVIHDCAGFFESGTDTHSPLSTDIWIYDNLCYGKSNGFGDNNYPGKAMNSGQTRGVSGSPGVLLRDFSDSYLVGNTIDMGPNGTSAFLVMLYESGGYAGLFLRAVIKNNLLIQRNAKTVYYFEKDDMPAYPDRPSVDFNDVWRTDGNATLADYIDTTSGQSLGGNEFLTLATLRTRLGFENSGRSVDPLWVNRAARNYGLTSASTARDAGTQVTPMTDGFYGSAPDLGSEEYVTGQANAITATGTGQVYAAQVLKPNNPHLTVVF